MKWKDFLQNKNLRTEFIITIIILAAVLISLTNFLNFIELRQGVVLPDPLLKLFAPINLTWLIFGLIYLSLITAIIIFLKDPGRLMLVIQSYSLMIIFRIVAMYALPLNPPESMIQLNDPFVQYFGTGKLLTKDLFFSGHTATLFLLYLFAERKLLRITFLLSTILVALAVILQHVHYTIDVIAAPFFTYTSYRIIILLHKQRIKIGNLQ